MSESAQPIRIALVILENRQGEFALQLRSPIPSIANPDRWGIFGGHIEEGESPEQGALREIEEELNCRLDARKLSLVEEFSRPAGKDYFIFHYNVEDELDQAQLMEGEDFDFFRLGEILVGEIRGKEVISYHTQHLVSFVENREA